MTRQNVYIGCPTHDGRIHYKTSMMLYDQASKDHQLIIRIGQTSLLNFNCNIMLAEVLNMRAQYDIKWFAMLHSDVVPEPYWLDKLIKIAEEKNCDMLSACIAIKDDGGDVSTGISNPYNNHWNYMRLNFDMLSQLPETFSRDDLQFPGVNEHDSKLLVNTGCCVIRMDKPWSHQLCFKVTDKIIVNHDAKFQAIVDPEDWDMSKQVHDAGGLVMATTAVKCDHVGQRAYPVRLNVVKNA